MRIAPAMRPTLLLVLVLARPGPARADDPSGRTTSILVQRSSQVVYRLGRTFLFAGSDSVWSSSRPWVRGQDYALDPLRGDLRLLRTVTPGETLWVAAAGLVAPPALEYARQRYRPADAPVDSAARPGGAPTPRPATQREPTVAPAGSQLAVTGNKTIAVEFGSQQDAALRQSLDLSVSGAVAPGLTLNGVLTDRDTPLSAQGASQDLQSIDRVLVELRSERLSAAFGDVPVTLGRGEFARLERRVQGVRAAWRDPGSAFEVAAASAQGEYHRITLRGTEGLQGPYLLTDRDGALGVTVVAGSEQVTLDGERLTRGEAADYAIDYERARLTFSNRRPITAASRITIEYQYAVTRFKRALAAASGELRRGAWTLGVAALREADDRGRPLDLVFDATDRASLELAGDSLALGAGVTPGVGDYDTLRVAPDTLVFAFAGIDSGAFAVRFARVGPGLGDYADSAFVDGRATFRWVGPGRGAYRVGRALPRPEAHDLVALTASAGRGALRLDLEGALSRRDLNTFSSRDDADAVGGAGRLGLSLEGRAPGVPGTAGVTLSARQVERRFQSLSRLSAAFAEEDWGLPAGSDLDHTRRGDVAGFWRPDARRELRGDVARLDSPEGYTGWRRRLQWSDTGPLASRLSWVDADGALSDTVTGLGRERVSGEVRWTLARVIPVLRGDWDRLRTPSASGRAEARGEEAAFELQSGASVPWRLGAGVLWRRDATVTAASRTASRAFAWRSAIESPAGGPWGATVLLQRRITRDETAGSRRGTDLATLRLRAEPPRTGLTGSYDAEVTGEAENRRTRTLVFVGNGLGSYDAFGNFVGTGGAYDLVLTVSPEFERLTRVASSARAAWRFGSSEAWRGSRVEFVKDDESRRRGALRVADGMLSTGAALDDPDFARASVTQRLEADLAPGSRSHALRARLERRVQADRSFEGFAQTTDVRSGTLRWRARPTPAWSIEGEGRAQWQQAEQAATSAGRFARTITEQGAQLVAAWQPGSALRAAWTVDAGWARPDGATVSTRTLRLGPDVGFSLGARGRSELALRRAFLTGPAAVSLLPSADPAGAPRWEGSVRTDVRMHTTTVIGISASVRERPGRAAVVQGRAEVRAFF